MIPESIAKPADPTQKTRGERTRADDILRSLSEGTARAKGDEFFRSLVRHLASALGVRSAFVAECTTPARTEVRTLAFWDGGGFANDVTFAVAGTPCENVLKGEPYTQPTGLQRSFPDDVGLEKINADSYLGVPVYDSEGDVLGHLAVLDEKPLVPGSQEIAILQVFAGRTGIELERKRAEDALRESEARYRSLYNKTPVMLHSSDAEGRLVSVSDHWLEALGYERRDVIGRPNTDFLTEASARYARETCIPRFMERGTIVDEPLQFRKKNGDVIDVLLSAVAERDADGGFVRTFVVSVDVTERNRAERAVKRYTKRLETLQEIDRAILAARSPTAVARAALERIRELIPCLRATVTEYDRDSGEGVVQVIHAEGATGVDVGDRIPLEAFGARADLEAGRVHVVDDIHALPSSPLVESLKAEGVRSWIDVPLVAQRELIGTLNVGSDDTCGFAPEDVEAVREIANSLAIAIRQSRLLERLSRQAAELEERVAERTRELETFSYSISHDLRTPLRAIAGFSQMLWDDHSEKLDEEGRRLLDVVRRRADDMGRMIDDLLGFFQLSRRPMNPTSIEMTALVREAVEEAGLSLSPTRRRLTIETLPPARGDRAMIRQIFVNLLSNAIKFTEPKEFPLIEVGHHRTEDEIAYFVRDNGVGFDDRYADKLFGVFQRLHPSEEFEGTGLGLAITHRIVHRHGGRIWAEGKVGEGATVYFTLGA